MQTIVKQLIGVNMNIVSKTLVGVALLGMSHTVNASFIVDSTYTGNYDYLGKASNNFATNGDPHNLTIIDGLYGLDLDPILVDGLSDEGSTTFVPSLISGLNSTGNYSFDWTIDGPTGSWDFVGLGVKAGNTNHYFKLNPIATIPVSGSFNLKDELIEEGFEENEIKAISHVDFFGVQTVESSAPAPATGILAALGVASVFAFRRKKKTG
jgi:hypothetical protein